MAVALAASYSVNSATQAINQTITTASFTPTTGDLVVLKVITEDASVPAGAPSATGGGITWVKRAENLVGNTVYAALWTGTVTSGGSAMTVSVTTSGGLNGYVSMVLERWTGAQFASPASVVYINGTTGTATGAITITGTGSVLSWLDGDWNASTGTVTYSGGATQDGIHAVASTYAAYYAYQTVSAGSQTFGLTSPTSQTYTLMAVEIQVSGQANPNSGSMMTMGVGI
ncbi:MAG TPA: hypothetical protein VIM31_00435 [Candidatus Microsaccharimonas sp.]|jgi:hypothetical protein